MQIKDLFLNPEEAIFGNKRHILIEKSCDFLKKDAFFNKCFLFYHDTNDLDDVLYYSAKFGSLQIFKYLAEKRGVRVEHKELNFSVVYNNLNIVDYIIKNHRNADIDINYALRLAVYNERLEIIKYLIEQGANIHAIVI